MKKCLICAEPISPFMSFGQMPIANGFLTEKEFKNEYFFELAVAFCSKCFMVQLTEQPDRERMFHENYAFYSSTSKGMQAHFEKFALDVIEKYSLDKTSYVIEIGSNDGIMLKHFADRNIGHTGVEPSSNVADIAFQSGVSTMCCFFDDKFYSTDQADVILAANVLCHISDIHSVIRTVKRILKPDGVLIFEDPYLGDILEKTSYDQIYDEHAFYFSLLSVSYLFGLYGMEIIDIARQDVHGGSMRYTIANTGMFPKSEAVMEQLLEEYSSGLNELLPYVIFRDAVRWSRIELIDILENIKVNGGNIVGYAATSKSTTVINYCGITPNLVEYISDTTPIKQGKFSPGKHIPIKPYEQFKKNPPTHALLFGWNHEKEIMQKELGYKGKWIVYVPEVKIL